MSTQKPHDFEQTIRDELERIRPLVHMYPWTDRIAYADYLSNMYYFLAHACRLLTAAAAHCPVEMDEFHHRFVSHTLEEKNHDKLALADLQGLGVELMPCRASLPPLWQSQYYIIEKQSPLGLFGLIAYLETLSITPGLAPWTYEIVKKEFGDKATSFLRVHVHEDADHIQKLAVMLQKLPEAAKPIVMESLRITSSIYFNYMLEATMAYTKKGLSDLKLVA